MKTETLPFLNNGRIQGAENQNKRGNFTSAAGATSRATEFPMEKFIYLAPADKKNLIWASQVNVSANINLAKNSLIASEVEENLEKARKGIIIVYRNAYVKEATQASGADNESKESKKRMSADELEYSLTLAAFTGDAALLKSAIHKMNQAISDATDPLEKKSIEFRKYRIKFHTNDAQDNFDVLKESFRNVMSKSKENKLPKTSIAVIAAQYTTDSWRSKQLLGALEGGYEYLKTLICDSSVWGTFSREFRQTTSESRRHKNWQATKPDGVDYSIMQLPSSVF